MAGWSLQEAFEALIPDHLKAELRAVKTALAHARTKDLLTSSVLEGGNVDEKAEARDWLKRLEAGLIRTERDIEHYLEEQLNSAVCHEGRHPPMDPDGGGGVVREWLESATRPGRGSRGISSGSRPGR